MGAVAAWCCQSSGIRDDTATFTDLPPSQVSPPFHLAIKRIIWKSDVCKHYLREICRLSSEKHWDSNLPLFVKRAATCWNT